MIKGESAGDSNVMHSVTLHFYTHYRVATARTRDAAARNYAVRDPERPGKALLPQSAMSSSTIRERAA